MQFYLDGYKPGDPDILTAELPNAVDVLIVGSGPAGALLAAQLSTFPSISTRLVERLDGPLRVGQADGVACRTAEMFDAFGLSGKLIREAYWVNETVFWRPSKADRSRIERTGRVQDTEDGLSEFPHLIVNQARMQKYLLDYMRNSPTRLEANYGLEFLDLNVETEGEHPVVVTLRKVANGAESAVRAKYVVGCDGGHSTVRQQIGIERGGADFNELMVLALFRSRELHEKLKRFPPRSTYRVIHPDLRGYWQFFGRVDVGESWFFHSPVPADTTRDNYDFHGLLQKAAGFSFACDFDYVGFWDLRIAVAEKYQVGRILDRKSVV